MGVPRRVLLTALVHLGGCVAVALGVVTQFPVIVPLALWCLVAGYTIREYRPDLVRWWKQRRKYGGITEEHVNLSEAFARLPKSDLGEGATCGELPNGANMVRLADGSFRMALPVRVAATGSSGFTTGSATLVKHNDDG